VQCLKVGPRPLEGSTLGPIFPDGQRKNCKLSRLASVALRPTGGLNNIQYLGGEGGTLAPGPPGQRRLPFPRGRCCPLSLPLAAFSFSFSLQSLFSLAVGSCLPARSLGSLLASSLARRLRCACMESNQRTENEERSRSFFLSLSLPLLRSARFSSLHSLTKNLSLFSWLWKGSGAQKRWGGVGGRLSRRVELGEYMGERGKGEATVKEKGDR